MSEEFQNNWAPRKENILRFSTGNACVVKKPGPELALKTAHLNRRLRALREVSADEQGKRLEGATEEERELDALETMTEEQKRTSYDLMCIIVAACVKRPPIYVNPKPGQVGVSDIDEAEFLAVYQWYQAGCPDLADETEGVTAADADRFPAEQSGGDGAGDNVLDVSSEAEPMVANP